MIQYQTIKIRRHLIKNCLYVAIKNNIINNDSMSEERISNGIDTRQFYHVSNVEVL